jgi:hypothetical protein
MKDTLMPNTTDNPDLAARIAQLPRDVRAGLATLSETEQRAYIQSLDKVSEMEARGETFTPGTPAPYGVTKSGKPKAKPGRKPAQAPGARTAERPEPVLREMDLETIAEHPEDHPDVPVQFGRTDAPAAEQQATKAPSAEERERAERAEQEAQLAATLERSGAIASDVLAGPFDAIQLRPEGDPDDLANYTVEKVPCQLRMTDTGRAYQLEVRFEGQAWEPVGGSHRDPPGSATVMAMKRIRPVDWDQFGLALAALPKPHPYIQAREGKVTYGAGELAPKTDAERQAFNRQVREDMAQQRSSMKARGPRDGGSSDGGYSWI